MSVGYNQKYVLEEPVEKWGPKRAHWGYKGKATGPTGASHRNLLVEADTVLEGIGAMGAV